MICHCSIWRIGIPDYAIKSEMIEDMSMASPPLLLLLEQSVKCCIMLIDRIVL